MEEWKEKLNHPIKTWSPLWDLSFTLLSSLSIQQFLFIRSIWSNYLGMFLERCMPFLSCQKFIWYVDSFLLYIFISQMPSLLFKNFIRNIFTIRFPPNLYSIIPIHISMLRIIIFPYSSPTTFISFFLFFKICFLPLSIYIFVHFPLPCIIVKISFLNNLSNLQSRVFHHRSSFTIIFFRGSFF